MTDQNENLEQFQKRLRSRFGWLIIYNFLLVLFVALGLLHPTGGTNEITQSFMMGFHMGLYLVAQTQLVLFMAKYSRAIRSQEKCKSLYIYENDERRKFISSQIGGKGINIILGGLILGTLAAGFINQTVFFSFLAALLFSALVKGVLKLYYNKVL